MTYFKRLILLLAITLFFASADIAKAANASLKFSPDNVSISLNNPFTVSIILDTAGYATGGTGAIIRFDPNVLRVEDVKRGDLYADYPLNAPDNDNGRLTISGIAASSEHLYTGQGVFATITFKPVATAKTDVTFSYEAGSTKDSNIAVTFGSGDVLSEVGTLRVNIVPAGFGDSPAVTAKKNPLGSVSKAAQNLKNTSMQFVAALKIPYLSDRYASVREGRLVSTRLDPLGPITAQPSITDPDSTQPAPSINYLQVSSVRNIHYALIGSVILICLAIVLIIRSARRPKI